MAPRKGDALRFRPSPPQIFATVSLALIVATLAATGQTQARFFRDAVIDREALIVRDLAGALSVAAITPDDMGHYARADVQARFAQNFAVLKNLSGVVRVKVFDANGTIVWSDEPKLVGRRATRHEADLEAAIHGLPRAVVNPAHRPSHADEGLPAQELIEFYVPFRTAASAGEGGPVEGAFSLYRSATDLNFTIRRGLALLWAVSGLGAALLFAALYLLFRSVYRRQQAAERQFAKLSTEHERIVQLEKLSAIGQMVGEIAHQFNNPLVGVINLAQRAERQTGDPQRVRELLGEIRRAGEHCSGFVRRMLEFTRMSHFEPQPTELAALARETLELFRQTVGEHPAIEFSVTLEPAVARADPVLLRHALFNIVHNASQADEGGPVLVSLAPAEQAGACTWEFVVADRGPGIAPDVAAKLFTPFFSTRPGGTGLGLAVARHIAVLHGGGIRCEANPGGGARFVLWLPGTGEEP